MKLGNEITKFMMLFFQVIITAVSNRNLKLPETMDKLYQVDDRERDTSEEKLAHTNQFR